jgi:hypothetical protein
MIKNISAQHPFGLRIPEDLKFQLEKAAVENARSLNSEMVLRLAESFRRPLIGYSDGELIAELLARYERGDIFIRVGRNEEGEQI